MIYVTGEGERSLNLSRAARLSNDAARRCESPCSEPMEIATRARIQYTLANRIIVSLPAETRRAGRDFATDRRSEIVSPELAIFVSTWSAEYIRPPYRPGVAARSRERRVYKGGEIGIAPPLRALREINSLF